MNTIFKLCLFSTVACLAFGSLVEASGKDNNPNKQKNRHFNKQQPCPMPHQVGNGNKNGNGNSNKNTNGNKNNNGNSNTNKNTNDVTVNVTTGTTNGHRGNRNNNNNNNRNLNGSLDGLGSVGNGLGNNSGPSGGTNSPTSTYSPSYSLGGATPNYGATGVTGALGAGAVPPPNALFNEDDPNTAWLTVEVPNEGAEVWLNGVKMPHQGLVRKFVSPPLDPKLMYNYDVKVQWTLNGVKQNHSVQIPLKSGDEIYHVVPKVGVNQVPAPKLTLTDEDTEKAAEIKLGFAKQLIADKKMDSVKGRLEDIIKKYPNTKSAEEAKGLLSKI